MGAGCRRVRGARQCGVQVPGCRVVSRAALSLVLPCRKEFDSASNWFDLVAWGDGDWAASAIVVSARDTDVLFSGGHASKVVSLKA